jgi:tetratricopeptide (TPR) repeat protein
VENDHRMFFPFVGLVLAVCWPVALWIYNWPAPRPLLSKAVAILCACELALCAMATRQRNTVWHTEESLWRDVAIKSPRNGRGWMNYALILAGRHDLQGALTYLNRASIYQPYYSRLELNLGVVYGELKHSVEAERHFRRAFRLAPDDLDCHVAYANWLDREGRSDEAMKHLRIAMTANPDALDSRYLMMTIDAKQARWTDVTAMAADILKRFPSDLTANAFVLMSDWETAGPARTAKALQTPDNFVNLSVLYFQADNLEKCIAAAREAPKLRPNYAEAYNNIAAAYQGLKDWDKASEAAHAALKIRPNYHPAQQNLARSEAQKKRAVDHQPD